MQIKMFNQNNIILSILFLIQFILYSCSNEPSKESEIANNKEKGISLINSIIQITGQDFNKGSSSSGFVKGEAVMKIIPSETEVQVIVKYRYLMSSGIQEATERGHLENFVITDDGVNNTKVIRADWINQDAGNGTFVLKSYNEDEPKTIIAQINAKGDGNWYHSTWVELTDEEYDKFLKAVSVNEESLVDLNNYIVDSLTFKVGKIVPESNELSADSKKIYYIQGCFKNVEMGDFYHYIFNRKDDKEISFWYSDVLKQFMSKDESPNSQLIGKKYDIFFSVENINISESEDIKDFQKFYIVKKIIPVR
jgi:hypothetical protein